MMLSETWIWERLQLLIRLNDTLNRLYLKDQWDADFREKIAIDLTYESNRMEGNTLTYGETIAFLKQATLPQSRRLKDVLDIQNHQAVLTKVFGAYNGKEPRLPCRKRWVEMAGHRMIRCPFEPAKHPGTHRLRASPTQSGRSGAYSSAG